MINCPKCPSETLVETPALGNIPLDVCPGCSGIWFDKGELEALLKRSQEGAAADFALINPKPVGLVCSRCQNPMSRGGLVNPLLLVDKCESCGGVWLDSHELALAGKLLGVSEGLSGVTVARPAEAPPAPPAQETGFSVAKAVFALIAVIGLIGASFELYVYYSPVDSVSYSPSVGLSVSSAVFFIGGVFGLLRKK